jgi:hypothetical protein
MDACELGRHLGAIAHSTAKNYFSRRGAEDAEKHSHKPMLGGAILGKFYVTWRCNRIETWQEYTEGFLEG